MPLRFLWRRWLRSSAVLLPALAGCGHNTPAPAPDANTSLLASQPWRVVGFLDTDNTTKPPTTTNAFTGFAAYRRDDTYQFNTDTSLLFNDGPLKASASDPQTSTGSWQFQNSQTSLSITLRRTVTLGTTGITSSTTYSVRKLTTDTLRLSGGTQAQTVVITLAH